MSQDKTLVDLLKESWEERRKYFENIEFYATKIKKLAAQILGEDVLVILFGSIVRGEWNPNSDIDVLIVSDKLSENWEENCPIRTKIKSSISPFSPFQLHLATPKEFENWYKKFIKEEYLKI